MNVLLSCAGRRNYLVRYFGQALAGKGKVHAADCSKYAPALYEADECFVVPPISHKDYIDVILSICIKHDINMLIPLNDLELPLLASQKGRFLAAGIIPVVSSPEVVDICFDKCKTASFIKGLGLKAPNVYLNLAEFRLHLKEGLVSFPVVVKPRWGTASIGIEYPHDYEELELAYALANKGIPRSELAEVSSFDPDCTVIIQEFAKGQEYGLDIVNELDARYVCTFAKKKIVMRAGETDKAVTVSDIELESLGRKIGENLRHVGNLDCDVFVSKKGIYVLEMNPRFGGGYPFSHEAGANIPAALIAWAQKEKVDRDWFKAQEGTFSAKCDRLVARKMSQGEIDEMKR